MAEQCLQIAGNKFNGNAIITISNSATVYQP